jgi:hypothetical protein
MISNYFRENLATVALEVGRMPSYEWISYIDITSTITNFYVVI